MLVQGLSILQMTRKREVPRATIIPEPTDVRDDRGRTGLHSGATTDVGGLGVVSGR